MIMKKLILLIIVLTTIGCQSDIYKDENGIIKIKEDIQIGFIGEVDGVSYKVVDSTMLYTMVKNNEDIRFICTSKITNMKNLFEDSKFNGDISNWDVSNVTDMQVMFQGSEFNGDISNWDVNNVRDMNQMFSSSQFNGDISNWDVSNVTDMEWMFSNSQFNGDVSKWVNKPIINKPKINKPKIKNKKPDCTTRDENFIYTKMKQLNNDVISIQKVGKRKYFVQYVNWNTGSGESGSRVLDYSNQPCY